MKVAGFEFPDTCPSDCEFIDDVSKYGQSAVCTTCPVFSCGGPEPMVALDGYRLDWAGIMYKHVVTREISGVPHLPLEPSSVCEAEPDDG
jgi:hypothetical protein